MKKSIKTWSKVVLTIDKYDWKSLTAREASIIKLKRILSNGLGSDIGSHYCHVKRSFLFWKKHPMKLNIWPSHKTEINNKYLINSKIF
jgi:hypothetical protein